MFRFNGFFSGILQRTALLTAAFSGSLLVGCQSARQSAVVAPAAPPQVLLGSDPFSPLPDPVQAFRPITPEPVSVQHAVPPTVPRPQPETTSPLLQKKVDDLNGKVAELEKKLAEKDEELKLARLPIPIPDTPKPLPISPLPAPKAPLVLPTIDIKDVSSSADGENVRMQIPDTVLFLPGTMRLTPAGEDALRNIAAEIRTKYPNATLEIEGHTDSLRTDPTNATQKHEVASLKSQVVLQYFLQELQWKPEAVATSGYGSSRPIADDGTPEGRAQNNRIEIVVKEEGNREK